MKKFLIVSFLATAVFANQSCTKQDAPLKPGSTVQNFNASAMEATLKSSPEFSSFITSSNAIIASVNLAALENTNVAAARNLIRTEQLTRQEAAAVLQTLGLNDKIYFTNREIQVKSIALFQKKNNLSNEQSALVWERAITSSQSSFVPGFPLPNINGIISCVTEAGTTFAATTVICLALREIPYIGQALFEACEMEAINSLIEDLTDCIL